MRSVSDHPIDVACTCACCLLPEGGCDTVERDAADTGIGYCRSGGVRDACDGRATLAGGCHHTAGGGVALLFCEGVRARNESWHGHGRKSFTLRGMRALRRVFWSAQRSWVGRLLGARLSRLRRCVPFCESVRSRLASRHGHGTGWGCHLGALLLGCLNGARLRVRSDWPTEAFGILRVWGWAGVTVICHLATHFSADSVVRDSHDAPAVVWPGGDRRLTDVWPICT